MEDNSKTQAPDSQQTDRPILPRKPARYDFLKAANPDHPLITRYHDQMKIYNEYWLKANPPKEPEPKPQLKKLVEIDFVSLYGLFKEAYLEANAKEFNPELNNGEPKILAFTLLYYIFHNEAFLKSPILNKTINQPHLDKGLLVIGSYGCGKTSIFKAIRHLCFTALTDEEIKVKDVDGDMVSLQRYRRLFFAYFTTNDVVTDYEGCSTQEAKTRFWYIMSKGRHYYDDLMREREASNYGKLEIFKDILESRYDKRSPTMASLNYDGDTAETTLQAMGRKYGPRVYDRLFEMFNVVEVNGKSLRK